MANRDLCHGMPSDVPLVPSKLVLLDLGEGHSDLRRSPGTFAALVMPKYVDTLASALRMSNEALLRGMTRMVKALDWIHDRDYVHMDFKVSLGLMVSWLLPSLFSWSLPPFLCIAFVAF